MVGQYQTLLMVALRIGRVAHGGNPRRESGTSWGNPSVSSHKDRARPLGKLQVGLCQRRSRHS